MTDREIQDWCQAHRQTPAQLLTRTAVRQIACVSCGALAGHKCIAKRRNPTLREANHLERVMDAVRLFYFKEAA